MILTLAMIAPLMMQPSIDEIKSMSDEQAAIVASNTFVVMHQRHPVEYSKKYEPVSAIQILLNADDKEDKSQD